jgi:PAS domain-containing protein
MAPTGSLDLIGGRSDPVFAVDAEHRIVAWSKGCEDLLGLDASSVLGRHCYGVVCGTDVFANRFCDTHCAVFNLVRHGEPVNSFELNLRSAAGKTVRVSVSVYVTDQTASEFTLFHLLSPLEPVEKRGHADA